MTTKCTLALIALLLASHSTRAAEPAMPALLEYRATEPLSVADVAALAELKEEDGVMWVQPVSVNREALASDDVAIDLYDRQVQVRKSGSPRGPAKGVTLWSGNVVLDNGPTWIGSHMIFIVQENGRIGGTLYFGEDIYQVHFLRPGRGVLVKSKLPPDGGCVLVNRDDVVPGKGQSPEAARTALCGWNSRARRHPPAGDDVLQPVVADDLDDVGLLAQQRRELRPENGPGCMLDGGDARGSGQLVAQAAERGDLVLDPVQVRPMRLSMRSSASATGALTQTVEKESAPTPVRKGPSVRRI